MDEQNKDLPKSESEIAPQISDQTKLARHSFHLFKSFLFGFLFVVLLVVIGGGIFLGKNLKSENKQVTKTVITSPTPNPTSDWKTGKFNDLTFKYPSNFYGGEACGIYRIDTKPINKTCSPGEYTTAFDIVIYSNSNSLDSIKTEFSKDKLITDKKSEDLTIDSHPALMNKAVIPPGYSSENKLWSLYIFNGKELYRFRSIYEPSIEHENTFNKILSTFKFTDSSPTPTCRPRPSCLDSIPACKIVETSDMCPPTPNPSNSFAGPGEHCGGNIASARQCVSGYHCQLNKIADLGGTCVAN